MHGTPQDVLQPRLGQAPFLASTVKRQGSEGREGGRELADKKLQQWLVLVEDRSMAGSLGDMVLSTVFYLPFPQQKPSIIKC